MAETLMRRGLLAVVVIGLLALGAAITVRALSDGGEGGSGRSRGGGGPAAVEVATITRGSIADRLTVAGNLAPSAVVTVVPELDGRLIELLVDLGDQVARGSVIARLDDRDEQLALAAAEAALAVAEAEVVAARADLAEVERAAERSAELAARGVGTTAQQEDDKAAVAAAEAAIGVAVARRDAAATACEAARIELADCTVRVHWDGDDEERVVSARFVDVGATLRGGDPIVEVVRLQPIEVELQIAERDYARVSPGQTARVFTDAYPGEAFAASVVRVAPRFSETSRQAQVELLAPNEAGRLKPGMFVRAELVLAEAQDVTIVPYAALVSRRGAPAIYVVADDGASVRHVPVTVGIREGDRVQVDGEGVSGRVVTLGQHLLTDGSAIVIPADTAPAAGE